MSKEKGQQAKSQKNKLTGPKNNPRKRAHSLLIKLCTFVGFGASLIAFLPRPNVSAPTVPFDPEDPFSVSFDISNNGFVPLYNCTVSFGVGQLAGKGQQLDPLFIPSFKSRFVIPAWENHDLNMDDRITVVLNDFISDFACSADIAVIVSYNPWVIPIVREKIFRFVTFKQNNSHQYWRSWPVNEPLPSVQ